MSLSNASGTITKDKSDNDNNKKKNLPKKPPQRRQKILGQDPDVLRAMLANLLSWFVSTFAPSFLPRLLPPSSAEEEEEGEEEGGEKGGKLKAKTRCISIGRPGGLEQLRLVHLKEGVVTVGYNLTQTVGPSLYTPPLLLVDRTKDFPSDCVILRNESFSVNYADCVIRWGLYESAKRFVGWPIVPGFDVAGTIEYVGQEEEEETKQKARTCEGNDKNENDSTVVSIPQFKTGDKVFGVTLFGAYSSRVLIPKIQLRPMPHGLTTAQAASLPAVSLTALYALHLAGHYPNESKHNNRSILIHSAAGGVGSMLVQMSKLLGLHPIVGVVGSTTKVYEAKSLGCDVVIDKSQQNLWDAAENALLSTSLQGYATIMDANGVSTLQDSYDHLAPTGRLIVFGFHSNLPLGRAMLSFWEWIRMGKKMSRMPKFDPMELTVENKSVMGFNLSFFADEKVVATELLDQVCVWLSEGKLRCPRVVEMDVEQIGEAHQLLQSGKSVGKIVINA